MRQIAILFALLIVAIVALADTGHLPRFLHAIYDFPSADKVGHFVLFGLLNFFMTVALIRRFADRTPLRVALGTGLALGLLIGLEEFSQKLFATRTFDLIDLTASYLGLIAGGIGAIQVKKTQSPRG